MSERVVCNTSPLILLAKINRLRLLVQLYDDVILPASVVEEMEAKPGLDVEKVRSRMEHQQFQVRRASRQSLQDVPADLGAGEREALALAVESNAPLVILDDQQGRRAARERGLQVTGAIEVLVEARARGMIADIRHELDRLMEAGMWISEMFYHRLLREFGE